MTTISIFALAGYHAPMLALSNSLGFLLCAKVHRCASVTARPPRRPPRT